MNNIKQHRIKMGYPEGENSTRSKFDEEYREFSEEKDKGNYYTKAFREEFADLIISGYGFFESIGYNLEEIIAAKIEKNERRG